MNRANAGQDVARPRHFAAALEDMVTALQALLSSCGSIEAAQPLLSVDALGVGQEPCFEATRRIGNSAEFFQTLADLLRVVFEPNPPGSMFLNSNWDLLTAGVPKEPCRLYFVSAVSAPGESLSATLVQRIAPRLPPDALRTPGTSSYLALCLPPGSRTATALKLVQTFIGAGFAPEAALEALNAVAAGAQDAKLPAAHAGVAYDPMLLPDQHRVSVWCFAAE